jgi:hypothetical protein
VVPAGLAVLLFGILGFSFAFRPIAAPTIPTPKPPEPTAAKASVTRSSTRLRRAQVDLPHKTIVKTEIAKTSVQQFALPIELRQPFEESFLSIWVDEQLVYNNVVRREKKSRFLHLGSAGLPYLTLVQAPLGNHVLRIQVKASSGKFDQVSSIQASLSPETNHKLVITCAEPQHLQLTIN